MYSERERVAHVVRRLGIGANPTRVLAYDTADAAVGHILSDSSQHVPPELTAPASWDAVDYEALWKDLMPWWFGVLESGERPLAERLTWFWHDHFAVGGGKVDNPYILWNHHRLIRRHATGNFTALLKAVAKDAAMLWYLDATENEADGLNENFGREVMELHTLGVGAYSQSDVTEISRAMTGWVVNEPHWDGGGFTYPAAQPWTGVFDRARHDPGSKSILGVAGKHDMDAALDILLDRPETARHVAAALYRELVGLEPPPATVQRLGTIFARDYEVMGLVGAIVEDRAFLSDEAVRSKIRTPLEKAATVLQGLPRSEDGDLEWLYWMLDKLNYLPLHPPNPAGFEAGTSLLDPARLLGSFELLYLCRNVDDDNAPDLDILTSLGLFDVSDETRRLLDRFPRPGLKLGLAFGSPEFLVV